MMQSVSKLSLTIALRYGFLRSCWRLSRAKCVQLFACQVCSWAPWPAVGFFSLVSCLVGLWSEPRWGYSP
jgi:hypothetical protein